MNLKKQNNRKIQIWFSYTLWNKSSKVIDGLIPSPLLFKFLHNVSFLLCAKKLSGKTSISEREKKPFQIQMKCILQHFKPEATLKLFLSNSHDLHILNILKNALLPSGFITNMALLFILTFQNEQTAKNSPSCPHPP